MAVIDTLHEWQEALWRLEKALDTGGFEPLVCLGSLTAHTRAGACGHEVYVKLEFYSQGLVYETGEYETFEEAQMELLDALGIELPEEAQG